MNNHIIIKELQTKNNIANTEIARLNRHIEVLKTERELSDKHHTQDKKHIMESYQIAINFKREILDKNQEAISILSQIETLNPSTLKSIQQAINLLSDENAN